MRILVADDEPDVLTLIQAALRDHDVQTASSADEAYAACRRAIPDLLLLDVAMPGESGTDLLRRLRADGLTPANVVLVSALREEELAPLADRSETDYLCKPFTVRQLRSALEPILEGRHA